MNLEPPKFHKQSTTMVDLDYLLDRILVRLKLSKPYWIKDILLHLEINLHLLTFRETTLALVSRIINATHPLELLTYIGKNSVAPHGMDIKVP